MTRALACLVIMLAGATAAAQTFHAATPVKIIELAPLSSATGTTLLVNDETTDVTVGAITHDACDPEVVVSPLTGFTVAAGSAKPMTIHCTSPAAGIQRCLLHATDPNGLPLIDFEAVCETTSDPTLSPATNPIMFATVAVGDSASIVTTIHDTATTGAAIGKLAFELDDLDGNFTLGAPCNPDARECNAAIVPVAPGGDATITVKCTPRSAGAHVAELYIASDTGQHLTGTPDAITLGCTGVAASGPALVVSPLSIDAGAIEVLGGTATSAVHVDNVGSGNVVVTDVRVVDTGTGAALDWTATAGTACSGAIPPACTLGAADQLDLALGFDPSRLGARNALLLISYHDTADRTKTIPLDGIGVGATVELVGSTTLDFGRVPTTMASTVTIELVNSGNRDEAAAMIELMPPGGAFSTTPDPSIAVTTSAPAPLMVTCQSATAGTYMATLHVEAPDVTTAAINITLTCEVSDSPLYASPTSIRLGELRTGAAATHVMVGALAIGPAVSLAGAALSAPDPDLMLGGPLSGDTPSTVDLAIDPSVDGDLTDLIVITPVTGDEVDVPISGTVATASYDAPATVPLGTFCIDQPTTGTQIALVSTGTATIGLSAPAMASVATGFDLAFTAPSSYPARLAPGGSSNVELTPKRELTAGTIVDDLVWTTDVANQATAHTAITATFIDAGAAIAPSAVDFGQHAIHVDINDGQQVTIQNCDSQELTEVAPDVHEPFSIDSPSFPTALMPGETATFSVGFHPTAVGVYNDMLTISATQLVSPLVVTLRGEGVTGPGGGDAGTPGNGQDRTSFYACGGCSTGDPSGVIAIVIAAACAIAPRRRRRI